MSRNLARGVAFGAGLMWFFDPVQGGRRRQAVSGRLRRFVHRVDRDLDAFGRDLRNRLRGFKAEFRGAWRDLAVSDEKLVARVRSQLGRAVSHPKAIEVSADQGRVVLSGPVLASEVGQVLQCVADIAGVAGVENHLEAHAGPGNVPALQGASRPTAETQQSSVAHLGLTLTGAGLVAYTAPRSLVTGCVLGALGLMLLSNSSEPRPGQPGNGGRSQRQRPPRRMTSAVEAQTSATL
ncbi:MAG TPA: BON domain-containing protein [Bradyrhizobium sp.]|nr:BON domain-containing protein [Bradyrhizobium sp.]